jgi:hypothetical protein
MYKRGVQPKAKSPTGSSLRRPPGTDPLISLWHNISIRLAAVAMLGAISLLTGCGGGGIVSGPVESGSGQPPQLAVAPTTLAFGKVAAGTTSSQNINLSNSGPGTVTVSKVSATGPGFTLSALSLPMTLVQGQTVSFAVHFSPTLAGNSTGSVSIVSDALTSDLNVALSGTAVTQLLSANPATLSFGNVLMGTGSSLPIILTNTGTGSVVMSQVIVTGAGFSMSTIAMPLTLSPGQAARLAIHFSPTAAGTASGNVSVVSDSSSSPLNVSLSGTAVTQMLSASPSSVSFGNVLVTGSSSLPVVVTNTGTTSVVVSQAIVTGTGFGVSGPPLPLTLAAGQNTSFTITFMPTATGSVTGDLSIASTATDSPNIEYLSAVGVSQHSVTLTWVASTSPNVTGYHVYRGATSGGPYSRLNSSLVVATAYTDSTVQAGETYYYVTTAVDSQDVESAYSNQATAIVPSP